VRPESCRYFGVRRGKKVACRGGGKEREGGDPGMSMGRNAGGSLARNGSFRRGCILHISGAGGEALVLISLGREKAGRIAIAGKLRSESEKKRGHFYPRNQTER